MVDGARILIIIGVTVGFMHMRLTHPNYQAPTGFGPEWQCTAGGKGGNPLFCVKKELLHPANQAPPKS